jgi:hypothetical protein
VGRETRSGPHVGYDTTRNGEHRLPTPRPARPEGNPGPVSYHENKGEKNMKIAELHQGDFFTKKPIEDPKESQVWIRGAYDRSHKKYECQNFADANRFCYLKRDAEVYTDLVF